MNKKRLEALIKELAEDIEPSIQSVTVIFGLPTWITEAEAEELGGFEQITGLRGNGWEIREASENPWNPYVEAIIYTGLNGLNEKIDQIRHALTEFLAEKWCEVDDMRNERTHQAESEASKTSLEKYGD